MGLDPRSVANLMLDAADLRGSQVTNLSLQKILYFVHGRFLVEEGAPLIAGSFEAWQYGPVNLPVYDSFKRFGSGPITGRASRRDLASRKEFPAELPGDTELCQRIVDLAQPYFRLTAGRLVELSHAKNSPWDKVTKGPNGSRVFGLRITNENISENFRHHKVAVGEVPKIGEPNEESSPY